MKYILFIVSSLILFSSPLFGQQKNKIQLVYSKKMSVVKSLGPGIKKLNGNVRFKHGNTLVNCDSAYLDSRNNRMTAFSNVHIIDNDSVHIYGDILKYEGNTKFADLHNNVRLVDNTLTLTTEHLTYNMQTKSGFYHNGGTIVDGDNHLTSVHCVYQSESKMFYFKKDVVLTNPNYKMVSDTLDYNSRTETSFFHGPTTITSEENLIYCENGWYNTKTNISQYKENAYLQNDEQKLQGDSLYYDRNLSIGRAYNNVTITDTVQDIVLYGDYVEYKELGGVAFITKKPLAVFIDKEDSLFLHADTLMLLFDSVQEAEHLLSFHRTRFYRKDFQGKCDSMAYSFKDSLLEMFSEPVLWSDESQLTGEYMKLQMENQKAKQAFIEGSSFIVSIDTLTNYNQVKGRDMVGFFKNNELQKMEVYGNAESLYYVRDEDDALIGVNISVSSDMKVVVDSTGIKTIYYYSKPDAKIYPEKQLSPKDKKLKDFQWLEALRPKNRYDVYPAKQD